LGVIRIRLAKPHEGERLRDIAVEAKAYWGYDRERVIPWAAQGDFSPAGLRAKETFVADAGGRAVAWASLIPKGEVCWLDDLWVDPDRMRQGLGSRLFRHAAERAAALGAERLEWEAEPNAVPFYERMGGRYARDSGESEWGRILPVMALELAGAQEQVSS
jgi:GNAT superfamily N-acetyltransferase